MSADDKPFAEWIGRRSEAEDVVTERLVESFRAVFAPNLAETAADEAPLGLHWCLSPAIAPMDRLGVDGHPEKNRDLPPVPLPRRMWAGGALEFPAPLKIGDRVRRSSTITAIEGKRGRSGALCFVTVEHEFATARGVAIRERHDIVYREAATGPQASAPAPSSVRPSARSWRVETPPTLLFRYSSLTFNGHRIHYDLPYATGVEHYPGLVVHGPLQATLLLNLAAVAAGARPRRFEYRGLAPAVGGAALSVCAGADGRFWTAAADGRLHMDARTPAV